MNLYNIYNNIYSVICVNIDIQILCLLQYITFVIKFSEVIDIPFSLCLLFFIEGSNNMFDRNNDPKLLICGTTNPLFQ